MGMDKFQPEFVETAKKMDIDVFDRHDAYTWCDLVLQSGQETCFVELKSDGGKLSPKQEMLHWDLYVFSGGKQVDVIYENTKDAPEYKDKGCYSTSQGDIEDWRMYLYRLGLKSNNLIARKSVYNDLIEKYQTIFDEDIENWWQQPTPSLTGWVRYKVSPPEKYLIVLDTEKYYQEMIKNVNDNWEDVYKYHSIMNVYHAQSEDDLKEIYNEIRQEKQ